MVSRSDRVRQRRGGGEQPIRRGVPWGRTSRGAGGLLIMCLLAGCGGNPPMPARRLSQPSGKFSFVTPDGWHRSNLAGIDFIVLSGPADAGMRPNLFVDFVIADGTLDETADRVVSQYERHHRQYRETGRQEFHIASGLPGIRIEARREDLNALPLYTVHYVFQADSRCIVVTGTCAYTVRGKYATVFDEAMRTLESEKTNKYR